MCTLSVLPQADSLCITMNRDELRQRAEAGVYSSLAYCYPVDARAGGTWAGVNAHGTALCLLNRYQTPNRDNATSRGKLIPAALAQGEFSATVAFMRALALHHHNGFDCIVASHNAATLFQWDTHQLTEQSLNLDSGLMFTSSSERLHAVSRYRQQLFADWLARGQANDIGAYHLHQAPQQARSAVFMSRELTHTKSLVQIRLHREHSSLDYYDTASLQANVPLRALKPTHSWGSAQISAS